MSACLAWLDFNVSPKIDFESMVFALSNPLITHPASQFQVLIESMLWHVSNQVYLKVISNLKKHANYNIGLIDEYIFECLLEDICFENFSSRCMVWWKYVIRMFQMSLWPTVHKVTFYVGAFYKVINYVHINMYRDAMIHTQQPPVFCDAF